MSLRDTDTSPPIRLSDTRKLTLPLGLLITVLIAVAVSYAKWTSTAEQVDRHTAQINTLETSERTTREILIRIDENVKDLRRSQKP
jgi:hypothetical protein